ncbi:MAG: cupin domain-containing protein [Chloroflexota bacterium]
MTLPEKQKTDDKLFGQVNRIVDMVEYQAGSVVSRTIIDQKSGTVTLFAFDEGQGLAEHSAPFNAMVYVMDGKVRVIISGKPFELNAGDMIIMPANQPHALQAISRFKMMLIMIRA